MIRNLACFALLAAITACSFPTQADDTVYLLSFFQNNGRDGLHLAYSLDGKKWDAIKDNTSLLRPVVGKDKLMRDPSVTRGPDGTFHMVWTVSWNDRVIGYANSKDLINWSEQRTIPVMTHEPKCRNTWAPEIFYDARSKRYYIVWSSTIEGRFTETAGQSESKYNHRMYVTSTADFVSFAPTKLFHDPGFSCIDGYIAADGDRYLLFYKDETRYPDAKKVILMAESDRPDGPYKDLRQISPQTWVEGPSALKIDGKWNVYFDCYTRHCYGLSTSKDLVNWTDENVNLKMPPGTRHGRIFRVERAILDKLLELK